MYKITRDHIKKNPQILFVFGDNDLRVGMGGMAKDFRGEPNSIGIRTKKAPDMKSLYTDEEFKENQVKIDEDITEIKKKAKKYVGVCIPERIGMGRAQLHIKAPKTYNYMSKQLTKLLEEIKK